MKILLMTPLLLLLACSGTSSEAPPSMPKGYSYENKQENGLEKELDEVSGIEYDNGGFLAHNDEEGILYKLDERYKIQGELSFGEQGDYEEVKKVENALYVLKSKGDLFSMDYDGTAVSNMQQHKWPGEKVEFEAMFYDGKKQRLVIIAKKEKGDKDSRVTRGYAFYPGEGRFEEKPVFSLSWDEAGRVAGKELRTLRPSAAAIHPLTGDLYLLASIEKLLLVADLEGAVKEVHELDKKRFPQAEGITFDPDGNLYITNEEADKGEATLLSFSYQAVK